jgi:predicted nucleotidyltransferase
LHAFHIQGDAGALDTRKQITAAVKNVVEEDPRLMFAYLCGSLVRGEAFRDVDLGIYLRDPAENPFAVSFDMKERISRSLRGSGIVADADLFDVKILNDAPFTFLRRVFTEGILLVDRDPDRRTDLIEYVSMKYRECAGLLAEASLL